VNGRRWASRDKLERAGLFTLVEDPSTRPPERQPAGEGQIHVTLLCETGCPMLQRQAVPYRLKFPCNQRKAQVCRMTVEIKWSRKPVCLWLLKIRSCCGH
jgi:hypothetical protein